jgi:ferric-dicitrate binding protein FerR (iron transport regulator)
MDTPAQIWHLIARSLNGEASLREQEELLEILQQDELLQQQYDLLGRIWKEKQESIEEDSDAAQNTISKIITRAELEERHKRHIIGLYPGKRRLSKRKVWLAAASVIIIISAGTFWISNQSVSEKGKNQEALEARKGSRSRSLLPDGTTVWLNAGSKIYYDGDFTGPTREVRLEGEAFFDVVKQTDRPFIVHTSGIDIKVLGTAFNVKSYPEDKTVETTLYRGLVQVFRHEETEKKAIQLKPNQKLIFPKQAANETIKLSEDKVLSAKETPPSFTIDHIDSTKKENERIETAWLYSRLEIREDNFEEMARKLERWYNVTIIFTDEKVKQLSFVGTFENENVEQVFALLKFANNRFNYKINNHEIYVGSSE